MSGVAPDPAALTDLIARSRVTTLSGPPVTVAAITAGILGWLVVDEPVELGRHPLAATDERPKVGAVIGEWTITVGAGGFFMRDRPAARAVYDDSYVLVPVGWVAATVTVTHCLPIALATDEDMHPHPLPPHVCIENLADGRTVISEWVPSAKSSSIIDPEQTVWQSGGWLPGRWALQVTDPTPVEAP